VTEVVTYTGSCGEESHRLKRRRRKRLILATEGSADPLLQENRWIRQDGGLYRLQFHSPVRLIVGLRSFERKAADGGNFGTGGGSRKRKDNLGLLQRKFSPPTDGSMRKKSEGIPR